MKAGRHTAIRKWGAEGSRFSSCGLFGTDHDRFGDAFPSWHSILTACKTERSSTLWDKYTSVSAFEGYWDNRQGAVQMKPGRG